MGSFTGMVAMFLLRTRYRDIKKYNELATAEDAAEVTGWKVLKSSSAVPFTTVHN